MDGENKGKPYEQMDDLGVFPLFLVPLFMEIGHPNRKLYLPTIHFQVQTASDITWHILVDRLISLFELIVGFYMWAPRKV